LLENTWVIFTSDHGEMFERGIVEHNTDTMYEPILRVPLMIFEPGRTKGENIYTPTSAIDILPTLAHLSGNEIPDWGEGNVLPPFSGQSPDSNRSIYAVRALRTGEKDPITRTSIALVKDGYKLHYYQGYTDLNLPAEIIRLYDIQSDPEEMVDLAETHKEIASELLTEIKRKLDEANKPYL
jgi:arylsulfatase A-like enzyme